MAYRDKELERATRKAWYEKNKNQVNDRSREIAAKRYRDDPMWAAKKRARNILAGQVGLPLRLVADDLVEAKALQLLVRGEIVRPGFEVGQKLTDEERLRRKRAAWQKWYEKNKDQKAGYNREYWARCKKTA